MDIPLHRATGHFRATLLRIWTVTYLDMLFTTLVREKQSVATNGAIRSDPQQRVEGEPDRKPEGSVQDDMAPFLEQLQGGEGGELHEVMRMWVWGKKRIEWPRGRAVCNDSDAS